MGCSTARLHLSACLAATLLAACSGGGGSDGSNLAATPAPAPAPAPAPSGPTFTAGVFESADQFESQCETPRSGVDIEGNAFPDQQGATIDETFWLRSWTHETYLWNDEVVDRDPTPFTDRLEYFALLKTTEQTPSGEDKDDFHFSEPTEDFVAARNSAPNAGYGFQLIVASNTPPRDYRILYTEPGSPAAELEAGEPKFKRGTRILSIDGVDLIAGDTQSDINTLNAGLFPENSGETHTFEVLDVDGDVRTVSVVSDDIVEQPVNRTQLIDTPSGKVGYILFNTFSPFSSEEQIANAISLLKSDGVTDLVLDLRYNGGGLLAVASQLAYMVAGDAQTSGKTFELLQFNDDAGSQNPVTGEFNEPVPFIDTGLGFSLVNGAPLDSLDLTRLFILSTENTCSASEAVINGLRGIDVEIILIGDVTCGKPYGFYPTDNCGETYYTIQFRGLNEKGFGDYSDGFVPAESSFAFGERVSGCVVADDLSHELGDTDEALLAAALTYRDTGACPPAPATTSSSQIARTSAPGLELRTNARSPTEDILRQNRDMRTPY
ncbi:MAG: S41 family peptidase [Pseudomonadota bacterium]